MGVDHWTPGLLERDEWLDSGGFFGSDSGSGSGDSAGAATGAKAATATPRAVGHCCCPVFRSRADVCVACSTNLLC